MIHTQGKAKECQGCAPAGVDALENARTSVHKAALRSPPGRSRRGSKPIPKALPMLLPGQTLWGRKKARDHSNLLRFVKTLFEASFCW